jgi:tocopherol O-methyltransferase
LCLIIFYVYEGIITMGNNNNNNNNSEVVAYYDSKTESILSKYGPGPRVHYHGGLVAPDTVPASDVDGLSQQLAQSLENTLYEAARVWDAERYLSGTILDVGCGLGGGSIFWAQEYGARVFALTNVPRHVGLVSQFATQAGVADQIEPILGDAHVVPENGSFNAVVAIDSSCYLDREAWFRHLSPKLQSGGRVFIADIFAQRQDSREPVDCYYRTRIGSVDEYRQASTAGGFRLESVLDVTAHSVAFWELSIFHSRRLIESGVIADEKEVNRLQRSIDCHTWFRQQYLDGGIIYALLSFVCS